MIDCTDALLLLSARGERELTAGETRDIDAHLDTCEVCKSVGEFADVSAAPDSPATTGGATVTDVAELRVNADVPPPDVDLPVVDPEAYMWGDDIDQGGMGRVVQAHDRRLGRSVAIKELLVDSLRPRFEREARITARLQHPGIVPIYEAGQWPNGEPFYAMRMVSGRTLDRAIDDANGLRERLALLSHVIAAADALAYAHTEGVVHRDLKPANIMVGGFGETIVIDWGLAKDLRDDDADPDVHPYRSAQGQLTMAGSAMGTPSYMPPEQAAGDPADERSDVYSLGAMLYHVLSGTPPYADVDSAKARVDAVIAGPPRAIAELEPALAPDLVAIVDKAMARERADRYADAAELVADLKRFETGQLVTAHQYSASALFRRWLHKHRAMVASALVVVLLGVAGTVYSVQRIVRERNLARDQQVAASTAQRVAEQQKNVASSQRNRADTTVRLLLREQGRSELMRDRPLRALTYLSAAYAKDSTDPTTRLLLAEAARPADAIEAIFTPKQGELLAGRFTTKGRPLVAVEHDGKLSVWDPLAKTLVHAFASASKGRASFNRDATLIAFAISDHAIEVRRIADNSLVQTLSGHTRDIYDLTFSPDSSRLLSGSRDASARLWDLSTGKTIAVLKHAHPVGRAIFNASGDRMATTTLPVTPAVLWDGRTGARVATLGKPDKPAHEVVFDASGAFVATYQYRDHARVWNAKSGALLQRLQGIKGRITGLTFAQKAAYVAISTGEGPVRVYRRKDGKRLPSLRVHEGSSYVSRRFGAGIISSGVDGTMRLWDLPTGALASSFYGQPSMHPYPMDVSPDRSRILVRSGASQARILRTTRQRLSRSLRHDGKCVYAMEFAGGPNVVTSSFDGRAHYWDAERGVRLASFGGHKKAIGAIALDAARTRLVTASHDKTARVWNLKTGALISELVGHTKPVWDADISGDGTRVVTASLGKVARLWNAADGTLIAALRGHKQRLTSAKFDLSGSRIVTGSADNTARVWDAKTGKLLHVLRGHKAEVRIARGAFAANGNRMVSAGLDGVAIIWDLSSGALVRTLSGHAGAVMTASFDATGKRVVTGSYDTTARIWNVDTGLVIASLEGSADVLRRAAFTGTGDRVVGSTGRQTYIWDASSGAMMGKLQGAMAVAGAKGKRIVTSACTGALVWNLTTETRSPDVIAQLAKRTAPWKLRDDGRLVPTSRAKPRPVYIIPMVE